MREKNTTISIEYARWKFIKHSTENYKNNIPADLQYEVSNILERWLLSGISYFMKKNKVIDASGFHSFNQKAISELMEKNVPIEFIGDLNNIENSKRNTFVDIIRQINQFVTKPVKIVKGKCIIGETYIEYKDFKVCISQEKSKLFKRYNSRDVVKCALRYGILMSRGQQWSIPQKQYDYLYNNYSVRYEGFASPFNSKLIGKRDAKFCSLFKDTDKVFGSMGSFFDVELNKNQAWAINPPFIESIMINTSKKILKMLKSRYDVFVFYILPAWNDSSSIQMIKRSKYLKHIKVLRKNTYFYESEILRKKIKAKFNSVLFILSNRKFNGDLNKLTENMMMIY